MQYSIHRNMIVWDKMYTSTVLYWLILSLVGTFFFSQTIVILKRNEECDVIDVVDPVCKFILQENSSSQA